MNLILDEHYWTIRYRQNMTAWDVGRASKPIQQYLDQILDKDLHILIPGAGNAYEALYGFENGFNNLHILDISSVSLDNFRKICPDFPSDKIYQNDFFLHHGHYDLILEQTFFCALHPSRRIDYAKHMHRLLKPEGKVVGVLFNRRFPHDGPPFGGTKEEYLSYFKGLFEVVKMEPCYNSIPPRLGSELFICLRKVQ